MRRPGCKRIRRRTIRGARPATAGGHRVYVKLAKVQGIVSSCCMRRLARRSSRLGLIRAIRLLTRSSPPHPLDRLRILFLRELSAAVAALSAATASVSAATAFASNPSGSHPQRTPPHPRQPPAHPRYPPSHPRPPPRHLRQCRRIIGNHCGIRGHRRGICGSRRRIEAPRHNIRGNRIHPRQDRGQLEQRLQHPRPPPHHPR